ncbi:MAG: diacylglycerol kinase family protein [Candidatus Paceibacterota bacterium]
MNPREEAALAKVRSKNRFHHAFRGLYIFAKTTRNLTAHLLIALLTLLMGCYFGISNIEWMAVVFSIGLVLVAEAFNSAIEIDIDLTSPEYHPYARDTKDVAAGAVLLSALTASIVGIIIFLPKIWAMVQ